MAALAARLLRNAAATSAAVIVACGVSRPCLAQQEEVSIGLVLPLTGPMATYGVDARRIAGLLENKLSDYRYRYRFVLQDGQCGVGSSATTAAQKLIHVDKVRFLVVGCSGEIMQVAPLAEKAKVIAITYASIHPDVKLLGDYVFRTYVDITNGVSLLGEEIRRHAGQLAVLTEESSFTEGIKRLLIAELDEKIGFTAEFQVDESDFKPIVLRARAARPAAYYLNAAAPKTYQLLLLQLRKLGVEEPLFAYHHPADLESLRALGTLQDGVTYIGPPEIEDASPEFRALLEEYRSAYPEGPVIDILVRTSHDALLSIIKAVESVGPDAEAVKNALYTIRFQGALGTVSFDRNGDIEGLRWVIKRIEQGRPVRLAAQERPSGP